MLPQVEARCNQTCTQGGPLDPCLVGQGAMEKTVEFELVCPAHAVIYVVYIYLQEVRCYLS